MTPYCSVCSDNSTSGVEADDVITAVERRKSEYACVDCDGDRMCSDCAHAHRKQRLSRGHQMIALYDEMSRSLGSHLRLRGLVGRLYFFRERTYRLLAS